MKHTIDLILALQLLPIQYAGFVLLILGLFCMLIEFYLFMFGCLAIPGFIVFFIGSFLILSSGPVLILQLVVGLGFMTLLFILLTVGIAIRATRRKIITGKEGLVGHSGVVLSIHHKKIIVRILGESWQAESRHELIIGQKIRVTAVHGLLLTVENVE